MDRASNTWAQASRAGGAPPCGGPLFCSHVPFKAMDGSGSMRPQHRTRDLGGYGWTVQFLP